MEQPLIIVAIPTVTGREDHLARAISAYEETPEARVEVLQILNRPSCGEGWQRIADSIKADAHWRWGRVPDYLHLSADDLVPLPGWADAAMQAADIGVIPAPLVYDADTDYIQSCGSAGDGHLIPEVLADGTPCGMSVIPFCSWEQWQSIGPMPDLHYYSDDYFSFRARLAGLSIEVRSAYAFRHYNAAPSRGAGMSQPERAARDRADYQRYTTNR